MIELRGIRKVYSLGEEEVRALDGVDLTVGDHEFVAVIGPSGSGKSTLMNMIGCLDTPDEGEYYIDGDDVTDLTEHDLAVLLRCGDDAGEDVLLEKTGARAQHEIAARQTVRSGV